MTIHSISLEEGESFDAVRKVFAEYKQDNVTYRYAWDLVGGYNGRMTRETAKHFARWMKPIVKHLSAEQRALFYKHIISL